MPQGKLLQYVSEREAVLSDEEDSDGGDSVLSEELPIADHVFNYGGKGKQIGCNSASSFYGKHSSRPGSKNTGDSLSVTPSRPLNG